MMDLETSEIMGRIIDNWINGNRKDCIELIREYYNPVRIVALTIRYLGPGEGDNFADWISHNYPPERGE